MKLQDQADLAPIPKLYKKVPYFNSEILLKPELMFVLLGHYFIMSREGGNFVPICTHCNSSECSLLVY